MIVTPPMTLPGRGWGDGSDRGRRRGRSRGGSSCYTFSLADVPAKHGVPAVCGNSVEKNGSTRSIATGDTACISSSSSSSSIGIGSSNCCSGGGGDERVDAAATSSRRGKGRVRVAYFELSDGFSSAEEETWGSEGEIEESTAAGRHVIMHMHPGSGCAGRRHQGPSNVALARRDDSACLDARSVGGNSCGEGEGGSGELTPPLPIDQLDDAQLRLIRAAPFCGSVVAGLRIGHDGSFASVASAAAAAAAAASATRRAPVVGSRKVASGEKPRRSPGGSRVSMTRGVCDQGEQSRKHTVRLARPLSIEIANKASEFPSKAGAGAREDGKPCRGRAGVDGQEELAPGRSGGNVEEAGGAESYDEKNLLCGCAERCIRAAFYWYRSLALPMPLELSFVLGGGTRFSQLEEPPSSPFVKR